MKSITAKDFKEIPQSKNHFLLDVRTPDEHQICRIEGAVLIPLDSLVDKIDDIPKDRPVFVYCRSGNRSRQAVQKLSESGFSNLVNVEGGIQEYEKCGGKVVRHSRRLPIMQQVQVAAGVFILAGVLLAEFVHPAFRLLTAFVGLGLTFAGLTGFCGMAKLLGWMPWNRSLSACATKKEAFP